MDHSNQKYIFFLLPVVLLINLDCFAGSCLVSEISAFSLMGLNGALNEVSTAPKTYI